METYQVLRTVVLLQFKTWEPALLRLQNQSVIRKENCKYTCDSYSFETPKINSSGIKLFYYLKIEANKVWENNSLLIFGSSSQCHNISHINWSTR